jgi:proteasome lid subunit RPN8/RPN11
VSQDFRLEPWAIDAQVLDDVASHFRDSAPDECCGMLFGRQRAIVAARRARNISKDPRRRYLIDPADHFAAIRDARADGLDVVGFYHSHPASPPLPSATDLAEASYPDCLYLIVGFGETRPSFGLYSLTPGNFQTQPFVTVG